MNSLKIQYNSKVSLTRSLSKTDDRSFLFCKLDNKSAEVGILLSEKSDNKKDLWYNYKIGVGRPAQRKIC